MKKITFLALHLSYGGIEKCVCDAANLLCNDYEVEILSTYKIVDKIPFNLDKKIKVTYLTDVKPNKKEFKDALNHKNIIKIIKEGFKSIKVLYLKKHTMINALKQSNSDIYISTRIYFNNILGKYGKNKKIGWEHNHHNDDQKYINSLLSSCKNLNNLICVSNDLYKYYDKLFKNKNLKCKCVLIPNSINKLGDKKTKFNNTNLISVGRIEEEKGFFSLIDVFALINQVNKDVRLNIIGDGKLRNKLEEYIKISNLQDYIKIHGFQTPEYINNLYKESSIYLMTSYTESFGLVLIEAMSNGVVPIAFSCAKGPTEIITNDKDGYLIDNRDIYLMSKQVRDLLDNKDKLKELSNNAYKKASSYLNTNFKDKWINLLEEN